MNIDGNKLAKFCSTNEALSISSSLCREQIKVFENSTTDGKLLLACTQEAPMFLETSDKLGSKAADLRFTNILEKAGWVTAKGAPLTAKIAALLSEATLDIPDANSVMEISEGSLLVLGHGDTAVEAAASVSHCLDVMVILSGKRVVTPLKQWKFQYLNTTSREAAKGLMKKGSLSKIKATRPHSIPTYMNSY